MPEIDSDKWTGRGPKPTYFSWLYKKEKVDEHRRTNSRIYSDSDPTAAPGGNPGASAAEAPTEGAGENPGIVLGEITAYRCWDTSEGVYRSLNGYLWLPDEPMKAEDVTLAGSSGLYAFRTLAEAQKNAKNYSHRGGIAVGSIKMWGTIVEHKDGYRAEYAKIDKIVSGAVPEYSVSVREAIDKERSRGPEFEQRHIRDRDSYKFRCEQYGDFLSVFIEREGKKFTSALSLAGVGAITPVAGEPPKLGNAQFFLRKDVGELSFYRYPLEPASNGMMIYVPPPPSTPQGVDPGRYYGGMPSPFILDKCPIVATDDRIHLTGTGVIIYVPYGLGSEVFERILEATRKAKDD